jgi:anti-sigma factor RsiW
MTPEMDSNLPVGPDDLIAYLDGEVDAQTRQKIERCLVEDPQLVQRMREHQQAWDLLDELPREEVSGEFTKTTLEMVAVAAESDVEAAAVHSHNHRRWLRAVAGATLIAASLTGFWMATSRLARPNRQLLQDLPVIENLEAFQYAETIDFLLALENEGLFVAEENDEQ